MDKAAVRRWSVLLGALALTVAAIVYPTERSADVSDVATPRSPLEKKSELAQQIPTEINGESDGTGNPFAPRTWLAPPPPPPPAAKAEASVGSTAEPAPPPGPPALPFKYMGRLNDSGEQIIYLSRGDQPLVAQKGETLDGTYKVLAIETQKIEFEYLPTGDRQTLAIPLSE